MKIEETFFKIARFEKMNHGDILIAQVGSDSMVHAIKAFLPQDDRDKSSYVVSVGPFGDVDYPIVYEPRSLLNRPVLNVSARYRFVPSINPTDLGGLNGYSGTDLLGRVVLTQEEIYLGVAESRNRWERIAFLNVKTGELIRELPEGPAMVSCRWRIVSHNENSTQDVIFEHHVPPEGTKAQ
jgi:hypothetical protein